jgi:hypothetical protein
VHQTIFREIIFEKSSGFLSEIPFPEAKSDAPFRRKTDNDSSNNNYWPLDRMIKTFDIKGSVQRMNFSFMFLQAHQKQVRACVRMWDINRNARTNELNALLVLYTCVYNMRVYVFDTTYYLFYVLLYDVHSSC